MYNIHFLKLKKKNFLIYSYHFYNEIFIKIKIVVFLLMKIKYLDDQERGKAVPVHNKSRDKEKPVLHKTAVHEPVVHKAKGSYIITKTKE